MFGKTWYDDWTIQLDDRTLIISFPYAADKYREVFLELETKQQANDLQNIMTSLLWRVSK